MNWSQKENLNHRHINYHIQLRQIVSPPMQSQECLELPLYSICCSLWYPNKAITASASVITIQG